MRFLYTDQFGVVNIICVLWIQISLKYFIYALFGYNQFEVHAVYMCALWIQISIYALFVYRSV